ncbi:MAG: hypothetical protein RR911_00920 [Oscillospiraceae bacterium]
MKDKVDLKELIIRIKSDKKLLVILGIGLLGMVMLLFSELFGGENDAPKSKQKQVEYGNQYTYEQNYKVQVQDDLKKLISSIDGAGRTKVMVTLDSGSKSIYAVDENVKENSDSENKDSEYSKTSDYSRDTKHIIVNSADKNEDGLVIEIIQPQIRGVAIVCEGASSAVVRQNISDTVTAVLNISSTRVCITKMTND